MAAWLLAPLRVAAQSVGKVYRVGVLLHTSRTHPTTARIVRPLEQALRAAGYIEGQNLVIEWRGAEGRSERLAALAADLVARKVDVIVTGTDASTAAAKKATRTVPIVFVAGSDPIGQGFAKSLARPGGNATGLATFAELTVGKRLEILREAFPAITRVAGIYDPPSDHPAVAAFRDAARRLGMQLTLHEVRTEADLESELHAIALERPEGLFVVGSVIAYLHRKRVADFAAEQGIPLVGNFAEFVEAGALMSYSFNYSENYGRAVAYVDKILKGAKPGDLPIQQPMVLELAINLKTARTLGLTIPQSLLLRAYRVIE